MDGLDVQTVAFWHLQDWPDLLHQGPGSCTGPSQPVSFHFSGDVNCCVDRQSWAGPSEPTCNRQQIPECSGLRHGVWPRIWSKKKKLSNFAGHNLENLELSSFASVSSNEKFWYFAAAACTSVASLEDSAVLS